MKLNIIFCLTFLILVCGCSNEEGVKRGQTQIPEPENPSRLVSNKPDSLTTYDQVPDFVKKYLNSLYEGGFLIANPHEHWQAGCTAFEGEPRRQFIYAVIGERFFQMKYWQGGIAKVKMTFTAGLVNGKVLLHQIN